MMKKKDILKNSIDKNYFDKEIILKNVLSQESLKANLYEGEIVDIKEIDSYPEEPGTKHRFGAVARTKMRLAAMCILAFAVLLTGSIGGYSLLDKYRSDIDTGSFKKGTPEFQKAYGRLMLSMDKTQESKSGTIELEKQDTTKIICEYPINFKEKKEEKLIEERSSEIQEFNGINCRLTGEYSLSGKVLSNYSIMYFDGTIYEYGDGIWKIPESVMINTEGIGMKRFFKEDAFTVDNENITSIDVISNKSSTVYKIYEWNHDKESTLEYTVNSDDLIVKISGVLSKEGFSRSEEINIEDGNPYIQESSAGEWEDSEDYYEYIYYRTTIFNVNLFVKGVEIKEPGFDVIEKETEPTIKENDLDLDGDNLPDSLYMSNQKDFSTKIDFDFGNGESYAITNNSIIASTRQMETADLLGNGNKNIILLANAHENAVGGSMFILNKNTSGYEEWKTPLIPNGDAGSDCTGGIEYLLEKTEKYMYTLKRVEGYYDDALPVDVIDYRDDRSSELIEQYEGLNQEGTLGNYVDNIYKFELVRNSKNGYDIRIYQEARIGMTHEIFSKEIFGYVVTDIRYDENGEFSIIKTEFVVSCTHPEYNLPKLY